MLVKNASTDVTTYFVLRDSTNHAPKTDITITDIDLYYQEELTAQSAKADATALAAADSAHAYNKAFHCGNGIYRIDWPDEAFNGGVGKKVTLIVVCAGVDTTFLECELSAPVDVAMISGDATAADNCELMFDGTGYAGGTAKLGVDAVALSGDTTAADNAEKFFDGTGYAGTNNVIPTVTNLTNLPAVTTDWLTAAGVKADAVAKIQSGLALEATLTAIKGAGWSTQTLAAIDTLIDAIKAKTDNLPADPADDSDIDAQLATIAGYLDTEVAAILADTNEMQTDLVNGGRLDLLIDGIKTKTDLIPASPAAVGSAMTLATDALNAAALAADAVTEIQSGLSTLSAAQVNAEVVDALTVDVLADSVAADGSLPTLAQAVLMICRFLLERSITGTTMTVHKEDGTAVAMTFTLDDASNPTAYSRAS